MAICEGSRQEIEDNFRGVSVYSTYFIMVNFFILAVGVVFTSIFICARRKSVDVPRFVILQMICLNIMWVSFFIYYYFVLGGYLRTSSDQSLPEQTQLENIIATVGDLMMLIHDWLFLEQYLEASLMMPIALKMFRDFGSTDLTDEKVRARKIVFIVSVAFYTITFAWFATSAATGSAFVRLTMEIIFILETILFLWSFLRIQKLIKRENVGGSFIPKKNLMIVHLIVFISEVLIVGTTFVLYSVVYFTDDYSTVELENDCRTYIAFDFFYKLTTVTYTTRTFLTCYMNIKFSRELQKANCEFFLVFNGTEDSVRQIVYNNI